MTCPACHKETTAVRVGTSEYCRECGSRLSGAGAPRTMDLRPAKGGGRASTPAPQRAQSAAALHARTTRPAGHVLDLRASKPATAPKLDATERAETAAKTKPSTHWLADERAEAMAQPLSQVTHHLEAAPKPKATAKTIHLSRFEDRFKRAKEVPRSQGISRFGQHQAGAEPTAPESAPTPRLRARELEEGPVMPATAVTQHAAMARLAPSEGTPTPTAAASHFALGAHASQYAAVAAAVVIMGGYIWLQNYPKLAIQAAGNQAGISATMPGYMPSSYNLAKTDTAPGLVTLNFTSTNQTGNLAIAQQRTTWDSSSLLDNFVNHTSPEYTAVEGQGLTIYLYGQNQATWVNHGTWYQIKGTTRLSREQILKIAYSL